ncbi:hypothetical protein ACFV2Z_29470 [Streptomyces sp. NPDC059688]|uniref:Uncharacterized protein n=2 Tax=Streptomyces TaxID=1883 RepID=A0ABY6EFU4_9ACTN|nr:MULTISPECIES: hypothetical protein [unclassified Streptomyces]ROP55502.1 hypothetical protein EDD94_5058 [Streptomyces sp. PanSC9]UXY33727.1 hypothetical protein N8I86_02635 [Streptomyces sp. HUAS 14-6]
MADIPDELIALECTAEAARARLAGLTGDEYEAQVRRWRAAQDAVQAAIGAHAEATGAGRTDVERAVQQAVRCAQEDPAVE